MSEGGSLYSLAGKSIDYRWPVVIREHPLPPPAQSITDLIPNYQEEFERGLERRNWYRR